MTQSHKPSMPDHARHGLESVAAIHERAQQAVSRHHRVIERATNHIGQPHAIYAIAAIALLWMLWNSMGSRIGLPILDPPPFPDLQCAVSIAALMLTTMVLTTQNRHTRVSEARSHLDLQVSLLAEARMAKLIALVEELRLDLPNVPNRFDPVANEMKNPVDPTKLIEAIEQTIAPELVPPKEHAHEHKSPEPKR